MLFETDWPSRILPRTAARRLRARAEALCSMSTLKHSSMGRPARNRVANWRVTSDSSRRESLGRAKRSPRPRRVPTERMPSTASGARPRSRRSDLACRSVSASITPRVSRPPASSALYSKPDIGSGSYFRLIRDSFTGNAQHFLEAGLARAHPAQAVFAQVAHAGLTRGLGELGLRGTVVYQAPRVLVDEEQLENAAAALVPGPCARVAALRGVDGRLCPVAAVPEQAPLGCIGGVRAPASRAQAPHQALREHAAQ